MLYVDYNATAPIRAEVTAKMLPFLADEFGNPSSVQSAIGRRAAAAIEQAREQVAGFISCEAEEVIFLSGGTEATFHAFVGTRLANPAKRHIITSAVEHPAVLEACGFLARAWEGKTTVLPVDNQGQVDLRELFEAISMETGLFSIMTANNETGALLPIKRVAELGRERAIPVHTDAVQAAGKIPLSFAELGVDLMSISAHKFGGPKGVGALIVRRGCLWEPVIRGGGQEGGRRGGTQPVALIVGMGEAAKVRHAELKTGAMERMRLARDTFEQELQRSLRQAVINAAAVPRLPNTSNFFIPGVSAQAVINRLSERGVVLSAGSACKTGNAKPSHVLTAMGLSAEECSAAFRASFGVDAKPGQAQEVLRLLIEAVRSEGEDGAKCC